MSPSASAIVGVEQVYTHRVKLACRSSTSVLRLALATPVNRKDSPCRALLQMIAGCHGPQSREAA